MVLEDDDDFVAELQKVYDQFQSIYEIVLMIRQNLQLLISAWSLEFILV